MESKSTGIIVYRGPSMYDGSPIVAILHTGRAGNTKTTGAAGGLSALWIMPDNASAKGPLDGVRNGGDVAVCGTCPHRGKASGGDGSCYTHGNVLGRGGLALWGAYMRGRYMDGTAWTAETLAAALPVRPVRSAAYGDAGALPAEVWRKVEAAARMIGVTVRGYTHAWRTAAHLRGTHMASADSPRDAITAQANGWRTFRVRNATQPVRAGEIVCPASKEAGHKTTCDSCTLCSGGMRPTAPSPVIMDHGPTARRTLATLSIARG